MGKIAFVFPGQGAQYVGMGKDFYENCPTAKRVYDLAGEVTGLDLPSICFTENELLPVTEYTQIALLTTEIAILRVLEEKGLKADLAAGLSLGEYGALAVAGAFSDAELLELIRKRGIFMQNAYPEGGAMSAVLGLEGSTVAQICAQTPGIVSIANDNCPGQLVISGEKQAVEAAGKALTEAGAKRCLPLKVSGPFHSSLLQIAGEQLAEALQDKTVKPLQVPYICNVEARQVTDAGEVKELLIRQVSSGVRFRESLLLLQELGVDTLFEIGPGKTIAGFVKKMNTGMKVINIDRFHDLEQLNI